MAFPIEIDATALTSSRFFIPGVTGWLETKFVKSLQLDPGKYGFQIPVAIEESWGFEVTTEGKIQYDIAYDVNNPDVPGFLAGRGTSKITFVGYDIMLNAGPLKDATLFFRLVDVIGWLRTIESPHTVRLLPGTYQLALQTGEIAGALFEVTLDGKIQYNDALDISASPPGFFSKTDTDTTLILEGYPITLDASPLKGATIFFSLVSISGWLYTAESPQPVHLLPGTYQLGLQADAIAGAFFEVIFGGKIHYDDALDVQREPNDSRPPGYLAGNNTNTLRLEGYPITLDARPLVGIISSFYLGVGIYPLKPRDLHSIHLMPTHYNLTFIEGMMGKTSFEVTLGGTFSYAVEYDATNGGILQGKDGNVLKIIGYSLLVDASALQGISIILMPFNINIDSSVTSPQVISLIPYRDLMLELNSTPPQSAVFDMERNGTITLLEPYPFVTLEQRDRHPLIRLTTKIHREKRECRPPTVVHIAE